MQSLQNGSVDKNPRKSVSAYWEGVEQVFPDYLFAITFRKTIMDSFSDEKREIKKGPLADELNEHPNLGSSETPEKPLEHKNKEEGYSTDPAQGDAEISLPLADEDKDRYQGDPMAEAENLQESYNMAEETGKNDPGQTDQ